jgi:hypothetical protein
MNCILLLRRTFLNAQFAALAVSIRTLFILSLFILAVIAGRFQDFEPPAWAWLVWGVLLCVAIAAWVIVTRGVAFIVRKVVMLIPITRVMETSREDWHDVPVAEVRNAIRAIERQIRAWLYFSPLQWLGVWAFRSQTDFFLRSLVEHCQAHGSDVVDARMLATWTHGAVAKRLGEFVGDLVSSGCQIAVIVLVTLGLVFARLW